MWKNLSESVFFLQYGMHMDRNTTLQLPIYERIWLIERMIEQRQKENEEINKSKKKR